MKFSVRPQFQRLNDMIDRIRKGTTSGRYPNCATFMEVYGISRRTAMRDLDFLRDDWRAPVVYDASRKGFYLSDPSWVLPTLRLERREVFALGVARKIMASFRGTPFEEDIQSVLAKMTESIEGRVSMEPAALSGHITVLTEDYARQDPRIWMGVARYIQQCQRVLLDYRKFNGTKGIYMVDPYHLAAWHGDWYLLGYHHRRGHIASFALSRISRIRGTGELFPLPDPQAVRSFLEGGFGIGGTERILDIHLRFAPKVAAYIEGRVWHPTQEIRRRKDGFLDFKIRAVGWQELVRFVLSWQPDVKVIRPVSLRERIREKLQEAYTIASADECSGT